jgi:predicted transcriptional regulator
MIGFRVSPEFKEFLQELADGENRNLSNFMENAILTYIKDHKGTDWKKLKKKSKKSKK